MTDFKDGTWKGGEHRTDISGRFRVDQDETAASLPYPEATYWGIRTAYKVFDDGTTACVLVDASGNVILDASGNAILCP